MEQQITQKSNGNKFSSFYGIILLILALVSFCLSPAILSIIFSVGIIAGAIVCLANKYRLKGFTIAALVLAVLCLLGSVAQASRYGLFGTAQKEEPEVVAQVEESKTEESKVEESKVEESKVEESKVEESKSVEPSTEASTAEESKVPEAESKEPETKNSEESNTVNPDLKAFLDSYEAFVNEYVAFMKKYQDNPGDGFSMLADYTKIMAQYEDFSKKIDQYNEDDMSTADLQYYLEVTNRCNQKMLELY